jgi:hypothetical protein
MDLETKSLINHKVKIIWILHLDHIEDWATKFIVSHEGKKLSILCQIDAQGEYNKQEQTCNWIIIVY